MAVDIRGAGVTLRTDDADATVRALVAHQVPFRDLEVVGADLESAFMKLVAADGDRRSTH
jgi:ABC-2 type transport system ATP-binding protein